MDDKVIDLEDFDPAGMTQEELIETVVRLPDGREKRFGLYTKETPSSARNFRGSARRRVVGDDR